MYRFPYHFRDIRSSSHETNVTVDEDDDDVAAFFLFFSHIRKPYYWTIVAEERRRSRNLVSWWARSAILNDGPGARSRSNGRIKTGTSVRLTMTYTCVNGLSSCSYSLRTIWAHTGWPHGFSFIFIPAYLHMSKYTSLR